MPDPAFKRIGGHPAADFVNTVHGRVATGRAGRDYADRIVRDKLTEFRHLVDWAVGSGLITAAQARRWRAPESSATRAALSRAIRFREALYRIGKATIEGWRPRPRDIACLTALAEAARSTQRLRNRGGRLQWEWPPTRDRDRVLWPIALAAVTLFSGDEGRLLRQCPGERCGWLFVDRSRNHSRQWCDMRDCGNLAKVRRHRSRA